MAEKKLYSEQKELYKTSPPLGRPIPPSSSPRLRGLTGALANDSVENGVSAENGITAENGAIAENEIKADMAVQEQAAFAHGVFLLEKQLSRKALIQLRNEIRQKITEGEFPDGLEEALGYYWDNADEGLRRELISLILSKPALSRKKRLGLRPWKLEQWFLAKQMNKKEDLFLLDFLPRVAGASRDCLSEYFRQKYKQNLGANYFAWKKVIEGGL